MNDVVMFSRVWCRMCCEVFGRSMYSVDDYEGNSTRRNNTSRLWVGVDLVLMRPTVVYVVKNAHAARGTVGFALLHASVKVTAQK